MAARQPSTIPTEQMLEPGWYIGCFKMVAHAVTTADGEKTFYCSRHAPSHGVEAYENVVVHTSAVWAVPVGITSHPLRRSCPTCRKRLYFLDLDCSCYAVRRVLWAQYHRAEASPDSGVSSGSESDH